MIGNVERLLEWGGGVYMPLEGFLLVGSGVIGERHLLGRQQEETIAGQSLPS